MPTPYRVQYCGPNEAVPLSPGTLAQAAIFAQPGGGTVDDAWPHLRSHAATVRRYVQQGGQYLGFCLGAYLADPRWGYGIYAGTANRYIASAHASVRTIAATTVQVRWPDTARTMYFQDGPMFHAPGHTVVATYDNGDPAAVTARYGHGRVGLVGPHPEADSRWFSTASLPIPTCLDLTAGHILIAATTEGMGKDVCRTLVEVVGDYLHP